MPVPSPPCPRGWWSRCRAKRDKSDQSTGNDDDFLRHAAGLSNEYANSEKEKIIEKEELGKRKAGSNRQYSAPDVSILTLTYIRSIRPACARPVDWLVKTTLAQRLLTKQPTIGRRFP
jgi:hypothetical protein